jgi:hypothetical protein
MVHLLGAVNIMMARCHLMKGVKSKKLRFPEKILFQYFKWTSYIKMIVHLLSVVIMIGMFHITKGSYSN